MTFEQLFDGNMIKDHIKTLEDLQSTLEKSNLTLCFYCITNDDCEREIVMFKKDVPEKHYVFDSKLFNALSKAIDNALKAENKKMEDL
jgi:hypothetical protein